MLRGNRAGAVGATKVTSLPLCVSEGLQLAQAALGGDSTTLTASPLELLDLSLNDIGIAGAEAVAEGIRNNVRRLVSVLSCVRSL